MDPELDFAFLDSALDLEIAFGFAGRHDELAGDRVVMRMSVRLRMRISGIFLPSSAMCRGGRCSSVRFLGWG